MEQELDELFEWEAISDVILIAAGYEWTCPYCDAENEEVQVLDRVVCATCKHTFLGIPEHAYE